MIYVLTLQMKRYRNTTSLLIPKRWLRKGTQRPLSGLSERRHCRNQMQDECVMQPYMHTCAHTHAHIHYISRLQALKNAEYTRL